MARPPGEERPASARGRHRLLPACPAHSGPAVPPTHGSPVAGLSACLSSAPANCCKNPKGSEKGTSPGPAGPAHRPPAALRTHRPRRASQAAHARNGTPGRQAFGPWEGFPIKSPYFKEVFRPWEASSGGDSEKQFKVPGVRQSDRPPKPPKQYMETSGVCGPLAVALQAAPGQSPVCPSGRLMD